LLAVVAAVVAVTVAVVAVDVDAVDVVVVDVAAALGYGFAFALAAVGAVGAAGEPTTTKTTKTTKTTTTTKATTTTMALTKNLACVQGRAVQLHNGMQRFSRKYQGPVWYKANGLCVLSGVVRGYTSLMATLPEGCRPAAGRLIFPALYGGRMARIDVLQNGQIYYIAGGAPGHTSWLSFSGISFTPRNNAGRSASLVNGWVSYGYGYRAVQLNKIRNACVLSGLIRSGNWGHFANVAADCRPRDGRLIFSANNHENVARVDIAPGGEVIFSGGSHNHHWVNFDGMVWTATGGKSLSLQNGWANYGYGYRGASWRRVRHDHFFFF